MLYMKYTPSACENNRGNGLFAVIYREEKQLNVDLIDLCEKRVNRSTFDVGNRNWAL